MSLVLRAVSTRKGDVKRFDVVRAQEGEIEQVLEAIPEGEYKVLDGSSVTDVEVSYRVVQDIKTK